MSIGPVRLFHGSLAAETTVFTAGVLVVVRHLLVVNVSSGAASASVSIAGQRVIASEAVAANRRIEQWLIDPLAIGETITAASSVGGALTLLIEGLTL